MANDNNKPNFNVPKGMVIAMFPEEFIALNRELEYHPVLTDLMTNIPANEFELRIANIAAYCEIIVDGSYTPHDLINLAKICLEKLQDKRKKLILIDGQIH